MNGLISRKVIRFPLLLSACLLSGFVSGANYHGINYEALFPKEEINYSKISWITKSLDTEHISLAVVNYAPSELEKNEIKLDPFNFSIKKPHRNKFYSGHKNFEKLTEIVAKINSNDMFEDYLHASTHMQKSFLVAMNSPAAKLDEIMIASSSAEKNEVPEEVSQPVKIKQNRRHKKMSIQNLNTQKANQVDNTNFKRFEPEHVEAVETPIVKTEPEKITTNIAAEVKVSSNQLLGNQVEDQLLEQHIRNYVQNQNQKSNNLLASNKISEKIKSKSIESKIDEEIDHRNDVQNLVSNQNGCRILPKFKLLKPVPKSNEEDSQLCPTQKKWLSKDWNEEGWAKVETEGYFPFLAYYPQISSNQVLLLDQNSVALLAIKSGVHFAHGMGMVLGVLPQGFKIEFSGRAEEVQYFELNDKKYFVILNVEPGAGVTELVSEKDQNENATVFTPVISDTITYLDLVKPITSDIPVKVVKGLKKDQLNLEVSGLTVGISTQTQIQAITSANGMAMIKNVKMVPGYPMFVDVSSKLNQEKSYQYRYQLNKRTSNGVFVLRQYPEKTIYQWLKQVKANLSDQSAMIFGQYNRKRLEGFKKNYSTKVESITEKFGLNAINYSVLWDEKISENEPLEGDLPRFLSVQVPEGLAQAHLVNEENQTVQTSLIPVSPRIINVVSE